MSKRHGDAIAIQAGACNPSGVALAIADACAEIRKEPGHTGTAQICADSAVRLMVHQLAYLCGVTSGAEGLHGGKDYAACFAECETEKNFDAKLRAFIPANA